MLSQDICEIDYNYRTNARDAVTSGQVTKVHGGTSMSKIIALTQGKVAIVDDGDFEWLNQFKWCAHKARNTYYAERAVRVGLKRKQLQMHRFILGLDFGDKRQGDHINMDGLDNRRANLRIATVAENLHNRGKQKNNTSGYKGVFWEKKDKKWRARIKVDGERMHLGLFHDPADAARAYDKAAKKHHGEFATTNF